jgi:hypothetical protein
LTIKRINTWAAGTTAKRLTSPEPLFPVAKGINGMLRRFWVVVSALFFTFSPGCADRSKPVQVKGIVTLDHKPVVGAMITFLSQKGGRDAHGWSGPDGSFELTTFSPNDGALAGDYKVIVNYKDPESSSAEMTDETKAMQAISKKPSLKKAPKYSIPSKYSDPAKTTLRVTVPLPAKVTLDLRTEEN